MGGLCADAKNYWTKIMQKFLLVSGGVILLIGLLWPWLHKLPLGKLPGDIVIQKPGFSFYFPITTLIVINLIIWLAIYFFRK